MTAPGDFASWRSALAGGKPDMHLDDPWCGYFKTRDNKATAKAPGGRWPTVACAIWRGADGQLQAERDGQSVPVEWLWPYVGNSPISYEAYTHWRETHQWPEKVKAA